MHGRIISGVAKTFDPELYRLKAEAERLGANPADIASAEQLREVITTRERINTRREMLDNAPTDVGNARREALELAGRMKEQGYTIQQIAAAVRPMLVNPGSTITGRKERQARRAARKAAGKGIFRKIGNALKDAGSFVWKGVAKLNPVLAGARVATLSLVSKNAGGIADQMRSKGSAEMRRKWENIGGDFAKLQKAVKKGTGQSITGLCGVDEDNEPNPNESAAENAAADGKGKEPLDKLWELAKPVIETLLGAVGINVQGKGKDTTVKVTKGGALDRQAKAEILRAFSKVEGKVTEAVRGQVRDALDPNTGAGPGYNSGDEKISPLVWGGLGIALLAILARK